MTTQFRFRQATADEWAIVIQKGHDLQTRVVLQSAAGEFCINDKGDVTIELKWRDISPVDASPAPLPPDAKSQQ